MNLKYRNYENLCSKWLLVNRPCCRSFISSSWDKPSHQYTGLYSSVELWQNLTNAPSGRTFLCLSLGSSFSCDNRAASSAMMNRDEPGPLGQSGSPIHWGIKPSLPGYLESSTDNLLSWIWAQGLQLWLCCYLSSLGPTFYLQFTFHHLLNILRHLHRTSNMQSSVSALL